MPRRLMTIIQPDIGLTFSLLTAIAKCIELSLLIDYSTYFKDGIQYWRLSIQCGVRFTEVLTIEISEIQFYFSVCVRLIEVSAE